MSIDSTITVSGWVGTQPRHVVTQNGTSFTVFRLGSTKRYFDRSQERWVDGATTWFTVKTWRTAAVNVAESLRRSDPVVVHGTLSTEVWESPDGPRTTLVVEADALGPDLTRGQATFRHTVHQAAGEGAGGSGSGTSAVVGHDGAGAGVPGDRPGDAVPGGGGPGDDASGDEGSGDDRAADGRSSGGRPGTSPRPPGVTAPSEDDPWQVGLVGGGPEMAASELAETVPAMSA